MQRRLPDLGEWPPLEWERWKDTAETLHMYMQIVGKVRLGLTPIQNHWWNYRFLSHGARPYCFGDAGRSRDVARYRI
jgi:Family of unknown function (DUF5996)